MTLLLDTLGVTRSQQEQNAVDQLVEKTQNNNHLGSQKGKTILQKKALAKYKTYESMLELIDLHSDFEKRYWDTIHCCEVLQQEGQYITGSYCGNRWCQVCSRIVTAKLIQAYGPVIQQFQNPRFVTLTIVNVTKPELTAAIKKMIREFIKINSNFRHHRPYRIIGIRKIEVEPSEHRGEYHPHFHIILDGEQEARELISEWLKAYPTADKRGQNIRACDEGSLAEFFKYVTKPVTKTKRNHSPGNSHHTAYQLDTIYRALDKKRIFQPIGIKKSLVKESVEGIISQKIPDLKFLPLKELSLWYWNQYKKDWLNIAGDHLSNHRMNKELLGFVSTPEYCRRN
jgi:plasmid rolling circle replication initiator protein Rep